MATSTFQFLQCQNKPKKSNVHTHKKSCCNCNLGNFAHVRMAQPASNKCEAPVPHIQPQARKTSNQNHPGYTASTQAQHRFKANFHFSGEQMYWHKNLKTKFSVVLERLGVTGFYSINGNLRSLIIDSWCNWLLLCTLLWVWETVFSKFYACRNKLLRSLVNSGSAKKVSIFALSTNKLPISLS